MLPENLNAWLSYLCQISEQKQLLSCSLGHALFTCAKVAHKGAVHASALKLKVVGTKAKLQEVANRQAQRF